MHLTARRPPLFMLIPPVAGRGGATSCLMGCGGSRLSRQRMAS